jgi:outer membrane immunogenic protein
MRLRSFLLATASSVAISSMASAADLAVRPAIKAPPPVLTWTGAYIGLNVGAARHDWSFTDKGCWFFDCSTFWTSSKNGFIGGIQAGYNWQSGSFVYGVEADFNWLGIKKSDTFGQPSFAFSEIANVKSEVNWLATFRGRIGLTSLNPTMVYVTGGLAVAGVKNRWGVGYTSVVAGQPPANWDSDFVDNEVRFGWTAGLGVEHMISQNWSFKAEVLYVDLGTRTKNVSGPFAFGSYTSEFSNSLVTARVGVNFKW